jgi:ABC-type phosphate transport system permease subunit
MQGPARPSFIRRALGTTVLYVVGIPMIVFGMLLVFTIVAVDTLERRFKKSLGLRQP